MEGKNKGRWCDLGATGAARRGVRAQEIELTGTWGKKTKETMIKREQGSQAVFFPLVSPLPVDGEQRTPTGSLSPSSPKTLELGQQNQR